MNSAHTTFVCTPLPEHSLLQGQTWWGSHTWRAPSGNTVNDIHDPLKPSNRRSKVDVCRILTQELSKLGPDLNDGILYTINLHEDLSRGPWWGYESLGAVSRSTPPPPPPPPPKKVPSEAC